MGLFCPPPPVAATSAVDDFLAEHPAAVTNGAIAFCTVVTLLACAIWMVRHPLAKMGGVIRNKHPAFAHAASFSHPKYEFTTKEEKVFKDVASLMQLIAVLFTIHAVLTAWAVCARLLTASGPAGEIVGDFFGDPLDGLQYAFFIRGASLGFAAIERTQGQDIMHLMNALSSQKWLWKQMRVPLFIKSIKLAATIGPLVHARM